MIPPLLNTGGHICATFAARLATLINAGLLRPSIADLLSREVYLNIGAANAQAALLSIVLGSSVHAFLILSGSESLGLLLTIGVAFVSLFLTVIILVPTLAIIVFIGARAKLDPDTLAGPIATGLVDAVELKISDPVLKANIIGGSLASVTIFVALGIAVHFLALALELPSPGLPTVVALAGVTGVLLTAITVPLAVASAFISDKLGESAEDFALPIVTTIIDLLGIIVLFIVANQLLNI